MPHPSDVLPKEVFVLDGSNALVPSNGKFIYAIMNPTASAMDATVKGSIYNYDGTAPAGYKQIASTATDVIPVPSGATIYGRFTSCSAESADLLCYVA
jgi:hypothetical protein|tara:strand:+ start:100 stop:393 length:294 start_codon:yes stop_codon:yes gene_type:complete